MKASSAVLAVTLAIAVPAAVCAGDEGAAHAGKKTFLVTTTHTPEKCLAMLDEFAAKDKKMLSKMNWGCKAGDHTGYAFVDAADEEAALSQLPEGNRANAKATMVTKFTPEQLREIHKKMDASK